jgi:hypothetical protein
VSGCRKVTNSPQKVGQITERSELPSGICRRASNFLTSQGRSPHHFLFVLRAVTRTSGTSKFTSIASEVVIDVSGLLTKHQFEMITKFITEVSTTFNPFLPRAKTARLFLSFLPPNARQTMKVDTKLLPRASRDPSFIQLKFSKLDLEEP